ncbi:MAG: TlyA family rRNA (cytidine-2'-O)-methyltransferase, partial [Oscillospiraceae bacterium]|nr:TlyA family rRNA (cytidine-2'-O)-methyltransferase [Oscillospiraceae bacterium]
MVNGKAVTKAGAVISDADDILFTGESLKYVGRGGLKLEGAIKSFSLDLNGMVCCDIGASTGGFTDCMLQNGAVKVFSVDVGHGQLAQKLIDDTRVVNLEGLNVKDLICDTLGCEVDFVASDLSFISCKYAIKAASRILKDGGQAVILIKPQFEVGKP